MRGGVPLIQQGFATYGSDSGHQTGGSAGGAPGRGGRGPQDPAAGRGPEGGRGPDGTIGRGGPTGSMPPQNPAANDWALNQEAMANLGYMQLKKTHDAAMVVMERIYGERPRFNYFFGNSQGGREALTVVQRYPADYDGVSAEVPIVSFSSVIST